MSNSLLLGVNIDHVATLRQARGTLYPDPLYAALEAQAAGADKITLHMREDRRHIQERDVHLIKAALQIPMNLELAVTENMLDFAMAIQPEHACLVPEKREELTTEGGLDVQAHLKTVTAAVRRLKANGSEVSLFIDPSPHQIDATIQTEATAIELHTGAYAEAKTAEDRADELKRIVHAAHYASQLGLVVNAGHGLHYHNVKPIAEIPSIRELNIGHAIIAHAIFCGLKEAVIQMRALMNESRA